VLDELEIQLENNDQYYTEALSDGDIINQNNNIMYCCDSLSDTIDSSSNRHREVHDANDYSTLII